MNSFIIIPHIRYCIYRQTYKDWLIKERTILDHEFVLVEEGQGYVFIEGKRHNAKRGSFFYFHPGLAHSLVTDPIKPMKFYAVHFSFAQVEYNNNKWNLFSEEVNLPLPNQIVVKKTLLHLKLLKQLCDIWAKNTNGNELIYCSLFQQFFSGVLSDYQISNANYSTNSKIENIIYYMQENINKKLSIPFLASRINLSPSYFSCVFKLYTGYTIIDYFNRLKIDRAKHLLLEGMKIKEVAEAVGIIDEFYFSRLFKKIEGISPVIYYNQIMSL